jgi:hypothetical protein
LEAARAEVLREAGTRSFVAGMESDRRFNGRVVSVFSLMRDGADLAEQLDACSNDLDAVIRPYIQIVEDGVNCEYTGYPLIDIWRYFRLTWTNAPRSIPARQLKILVRDAAVEQHPVVGIAELAGAAVKVGPRDKFIGWDPNAVTHWWREFPASKVRGWLLGTVDGAIAETYQGDFITRGLTSGNPERDSTQAVIAELRTIEKVARRTHEELSAGNRVADPEALTDSGWREEALKPLFVSKRAGRLAELLGLWRDLAALRRGNESDLAHFMASKEGRAVAVKVTRYAKARLQGTAISDLTVCGAIAPYNELIGGKLVAMAAASPEVVAAYRERYTTRPSIIASSNAGRRITRPAELVVVSTTGLYGVRPSQYDRLSVSARVFGGNAEERVAYVHLPTQTKGWGTFHFSNRTVSAMARYLKAATGRRRVSYAHGEGASPRLRLLREGLSALGLDPRDLLIHGLEKSLYVCKLIRNPRDYLLGLNPTPAFVLDVKAGPGATAEMVKWWLSRWVQGRVRRPEVLARIAEHSLVRPVQHGGRVRLPEEEEQISMFPG